MTNKWTFLDIIQDQGLAVNNLWVNNPFVLQFHKHNTPYLKIKYSLGK